MKHDQHRYRQTYRHSLRLMRLMQGATVSDWLWLCHFDRLREQVYVYNHAYHSVATVVGSQIGWPIIWVLARFHKKHILCSRALPRVDNIVQNIEEWSNRVKWSWHHRLSMAHRPSITVRFRKVPPCGELVAPEILWMTGHLKHCVMRECMKAISQARHDRSYCNMLPLTALGLRMLRNANFKAVPNDKDGGYALELRHEHHMVHEEILTGNSYSMILASNMKEEIHGAFTHYFKLCRDIETCIREPGLARELRKSVQNGFLVAKLKPTCKSHKPNGEVTHRPVHALPGYAFKGCSRWISMVLRRNLLRRNYLLKDTLQFIKSISQMRAKAEHIFIKLDVKDFFMSGDANDLVETSSRLVPENLVNTYMEVLHHLLYSQFVKSEEFPGEFWRVTKGTGMGLPHSGEVADGCFAVLVEDAWAIVPEVLQQHEIEGYWRFKDDILILATNHNKAVNFVRRILDLAGFFKVKCDNWTPGEVQFLEVTIYKDLVASKFVTRPKQRESDISKPLDPSSAHPAHVHSSWPKALTRRIAKLENSNEGVGEALHELERRFAENFADPSVIQMVERKVDDKQHAPDSGRPTWITFSYHPALWRALKRGVKKCIDGHFSRVYAWCFQHPPQFRIAWSNRLRNIASIVSRF